MENICMEALNKYGIESQERMAIEEMSELMNALMKKHRGRVTNDDVVTEIADVIIMMKQLQLHYGYQEVQKEISRKLDRLSKRMQDGQG